MKRISSKKSHLLLYLYNDTLFVWSLSRYELYGFEKAQAALYFYMEEFFEEVDEDSIYIRFNSIFEKDVLRKLIRLIASILKDKPIYKRSEEGSGDSYDECLDKKESFRYSFNIELNSDIFKIEFQSDSIKRTIYPAFSHIVSEKKEVVGISIKEFENGYKIYVDKELKKIVKDVSSLLPHIYDQIRLKHYNSHPFLIAIHAAVLFKDGVAFVFPGISGAGKSTLGAYLMYKGYSLLSDELCVLDDRGFVSSLPLSVTLKEGSWSVLEPFVKDIKKLKFHLRFDGQKIKYIAPVSIRKERVMPKKLVFVFPRYVKEGSFEFKSVSITEALRLFIDSGYHICNPKDFNSILRWLSVLSEAGLYRVQYSNLKDVYEKLEKAIL